jgi:calcyphosin
VSNGWGQFLDPRSVNGVAAVATAAQASMSSTLTSADMVVGRSSTRVHAPPGGRTSISFGDQDSSKAAPPAAPRVAPQAAAAPALQSVNEAEAADAPNQQGELFVGVCSVAGTPVRDAVLKALSGATVETFEVQDVLGLPFAAQALLQSGNQAVIVLGELLGDTPWCSREIAHSVLSSLVTLGVNKSSVPVIIGLNYTKLSSSAELSAHANKLVKGVHSLLGSNSSGNEQSQQQQQQQPTGGDRIPRSPQGSPVKGSANNNSGFARDAHDDTTTNTAAATNGRSSNSSSADLEQVLEQLRANLKKQGATGIFSLGKKFRIADDNSSGTLDSAEVTKVLKELKLSLTSEQTAQIFAHFDKSCDGSIDYTEFLTAVRGELNERRRHLVLAAFGLMDVDKNGILDCRDLRTRYKVNRHPDV